MTITQAEAYFDTCVSWDCQFHTMLSYTEANMVSAFWRCHPHLIHDSCSESKVISCVTDPTLASIYMILKSTDLATDNARHLLPLLLLAYQEGIHSFPVNVTIDRMGGGANPPHQRGTPAFPPSHLWQDTALLLLSLQLILEAAIPISTSILLQLIVIHMLVMTKIWSPLSPCV